MGVYGRHDGLGLPGAAGLPGLPSARTLGVTQPGHIAANAAAGAGVDLVYATPSQTNLDRNTVDMDTATYSIVVGAAELTTVWSDPDFDASQHAFYYARAIEIPTPRWPLIQAVKARIPPPDVVPLTGQERAWSSPIWYAPSAEARKASAGA